MLKKKKKYKRYKNRKRRNKTFINDMIIYKETQENLKANYN